MNTKTENKASIKKTGNREYTLACKKKFQVRYGYKGGKWNFRIGDFTLLTRVATGREGADRIAQLLRDSWFRSEKIDGACRAAVNKIANGDFKHLKDYQGKWDHNFSYGDRRSVTDTVAGIRETIVTHEVEITGEVEAVPPVIQRELAAIAA